jgi:hypothetical protein
MTKIMSITIKVTMYTICAVCAILAVRNIMLDHAFEAVVQTLVALIAWGQARTTDNGTDD